MLFLDNLRAVAIIMVVGVHTSAYCIPLLGSQRTIVSFIVHTVCVPVFFLVDGYIFAQSIELRKKFSYSNYIKKSAFRLLLPWILFTFLYEAARYFFELTGFLKEKFIVGHSLHEIVIDAYGSVISAQLYFLPALFIIRLCCPLFKKISAVQNSIFLPVVFLTYSIIYQSCIGFISPLLRIEGGNEPILHALWGIQYYLLGILLLKMAKLLDFKKLSIPFICLLFITLFFKSRLGYFGPILSQYFYLLALFFLFTHFDRGVPFLGIVGRNTMGIYLLHAPVFVNVVALVLNRFITIPYLSFISILLVTLFLTLAAAILIGLIPYGSLLFGVIQKKQK